MEPDATTPSSDRDERFAACLERLEELKAVKAFREVLEERLFLELLRANRGRLNEFPLLDTEQQSLMDMLLRRADGLHPGFDYIKDRFSAYLIELNHYGKARALGDAVQQEALAQSLERLETVLVKCLQGAIYASSVVKDNFSDAIIRHFGEVSLIKIEEITATMDFDENYWRAYIERFIKEEVRGAYDDILADRRYRLAREGQMLVIAFPFDAVLAKLQGTTKAISPTRVQSAFEEGATTEDGRGRVETALSLFAQAVIPQWEKRTERDELAFAARVAAMDVVVSEYCASVGEPGTRRGLMAEDCATVDEESAEAKTRREFLAELAAALCIGACVSLRVVREDLARALRTFSAKEAAWIVQLAGIFDAARLGLMLEHIMELDFAYLLREKGEADAGRIQIRSARARRAGREVVEALAGEGLSKVRRKQFFDDDPENPGFLFFVPKNPAELESRLRLFQIESELTKALVRLWENASFKVDLNVCINLAALGKVSTNLSARVADILGRYGIAPPGAAAPARTRANP